MNFIFRQKKKPVIDLYISGKEFINGISDDAKIKIGKVLNQLEGEIKTTTKIDIHKHTVDEKNYGYGADWPVALIEYIAHADWLKAIATTGGVITFAKHIANAFKKIFDKKECSLYLGINSAQFFAVHYLSKDINIENIELLNKFEINRKQAGFVSKEFLFIFGVNKSNFHVLDKSNKEKFYNGIIYTVHLDWLGNLKGLQRF